MQSLDLSLYPPVPLPKFLKVRQNFKQDRIEDIPGTIRQELAPFLNPLAGKRIAVGVGSRGISNIGIITKTVIDELLKAGANPFIIPAMGSHGGSTGDGQAEVLQSYGITEESMGVPIDASVDVEVIGELEPGLPIYISKSALNADGIVVIARIKPHTAFRGPIESGVAKMLAIGLGKQIGADSLHHQGFARFAELIPKAAQFMLQRTQVLFALAIVENAYYETCKLEIFSKEEIYLMEKEKALLLESKELIAKLLFPEFDVLVIEEFGKNISGDGQDPNVTGLCLTKAIIDGPRFKTSVVLNLTEETHGNANGIGVVDLIPRDVFDKIDFVKSYTNAFTSTESLAVKIPMVTASKEDALKLAVKFCNGVKPGQHKIVWIKNTLQLYEIIISEPLIEEAQANPKIDVFTNLIEINFIEGKPSFLWSAKEAER